MPSPLRLILAVPIVLAATLVSAPVGTVSALASPVTFPMPFRNADYEGHFSPIVHATRSHDTKRSHRHGSTNHTRDSNKTHHTGAPGNSSFKDHDHGPASIYHSLRAFRRDFSNLDEMMQKYSNRRDKAVSSSEDLQNMASESASQNGNDPAFERNAAGKLSEFQSNSQDSNDLLGQMAADKGLANYDKNNELETMLKDIVNANKNALSAVTTMVYNIPSLGPVLGPIVYEIKCIIDTTLNIIENMTDGLLNDLEPDLQGNSADANNITCSPQMKVLGLCMR